ncbi:MAG: hypothetical protein JSS93_06205 [Bacteroidetes bacterium]|nr:hypothetical protein [Bacteroidota bacterium]
MKRVLAIAFLVLYINSNTELHELMRLPVLFEHFSEHKNLAGGISLWNFLVMHYSTNQSHDAHDSRLPFKDPSHSFTAAVLVLPTLPFSLTYTQFVADVNHDNCYCETVFSSPLSEIFQPPKG